MNARFQPPSARKDAHPAYRPLDDAIPAREAGAGLACCCSARATVRAIMPATRARPHETDLLLCGHHYRASRAALAAAHATVQAVPGTSPDVAAWIGAASLAAA
ncbi:MAG TPA: hypothetical protein VME19_12855 [Streptosporangiaceae bacterium]|nr:hypothetical protein [Streptosporangiaceae bacterium]